MISAVNDADCFNGRHLFPAHVHRESLGPPGARPQASPTSHPIDRRQARSASRGERRSIGSRAAGEVGELCCPEHTIPSADKAIQDQDYVESLARCRNPGWRLGFRGVGAKMRSTDRRWATRLTSTVSSLTPGDGALFCLSTTESRWSAVS